MDRSAATEKELDALRAVLAELQTSPILEQFINVWEEIGLEESHRQDRRETIRLHLHNLLEEMVQEEEALRNKLMDSISSCSAELLELCEQLSIPKEMRLSIPKELCEHLPTPKELPNDCSLYEKEKQIRTRVDLLAKEKHGRMKRFKRLTEMEIAMCESVGEDSQLGPQWQAQIIPSEEDLGSFRKRIEELEEKKDQRQTLFFQTREKVMKIWQELEMEPQGGFEHLVASGDVRNFTFSLANMQLLKEFYQKTEEDAAQLEGVSVRLSETIRSLWERLEVPQAERDLFSEQHRGYKPKIIAALQAEVDRLNELKKQNMARFVEATRAELHKIWDLCFYGTEQRREFAPAFSDDFSEDLLSAHESELDRVRGFYADNKEVFRLVEKRESLWNKMLEFERKASDPNRYQDRGGQLQKELKMKKQTIKELPKAEKELESVLTMWERDHERYFMVRDNRYLDTIESQWEEKNEQREKEKMQRQKSKIENTMMEMTYGSKPSTPIKKRAVVTTPSSAPNKLRKVGPSPLVHSTKQQVNVQLSQSAAPRGRKPPIPSGKTPVRPQKRMGGSRKILGERNVSAASTLPHDETFLSQANVSLASTGSYNDFQHGLQQGLESQKTARSSSIPKSSSLNNLV